LAKEAAERIASKVASELNKWERENRIIHSIKDKMLKKFKRDCALLEDQITEIEGIKTLVTSFNSLFFFTPLNILHVTKCL
jgi:hypothetical protein